MYGQKPELHMGDVKVSVMVETPNATTVLEIGPDEIVFFEIVQALRKGKNGGQELLRLADIGARQETRRAISRMVYAGSPAPLQSGC